jgi:multidrug efflux pump subunit AcrA (membrane-fusion protein)
MEIIMKKQKYIILVAGAAIIIFSFLSMKALSGLKENPEPKPPVETLRFVKAKPIKYEDITASLTASGRVASRSEITISAEVSGKILEGKVPFKAGLSFGKGDLLVKIYDNEAALSLKAAVSSFLTQLAGILPDLKIDFPESYSKWYSFFERIEIQKDLPELPEFSSTQEKVFLASKNILSNYYTIKSSESRLKKYSIYAPFSGAITQVNVENGAIANVGATLGKIINTSSLELEVPLEVKDAKWINIGDRVLASEESGQDEWSGTVLRKAGDVNEETQSMSVYVSLTNNSSKPIYKGQYLKARFHGIPLNSVMELPRNAVFNSNEVFTVEDSLLTKEEINVVKVGEKTLFFNGLKENTEIVVEPLVNAPEQTKVKIIR